MNWKTGLTGSTLNIVNTEEKRLRVMAGPGTGKSFALKMRVARLLEEGQDPNRILAVTFTRNAAINLVQDLASLNVVGCQSVQASTLHSYCFSLLNKEHVFKYLDRTPRSIVTVSAKSMSFEGSMMINDLVNTQQFGGKSDCVKRVLAFEAAWARLQSESPGWPTDPTDKVFEKHLRLWLRFHQAMLIGELVPETLRFLRSNPTSDARTEFDHILVDEYQDLNRAEQEIIDILSENASLTIVGDADQSIYSFRHANPGGIMNFQTRHRATHDESLTQCRRCPIRVVEIADQLIRCNYQPNSQSRLQIMPGNSNGKIHIVQWKNQKQEAEGVAEYVGHIINNQKYKPTDILILTPRSQLAHKIRNNIKEKDIPIHSFYHEEILEKEVAQCAFALLTLLDNIKDRVALRWWLGRNSQSGLSNAYQKLREYCEDNDQSPIDVLQDIVEGKLNLPGTLYLVNPFTDLVNNIRDLSSLNICDLIDRLLPENNNDCSALRKIACDALTNSEDVQQLFRHIKNDVIQPEIPDGDFVRIMSPQKAKGLSSKIVIVTGCSEGLIPFINPKLSTGEQDNKINEQRRLFYVAVTRCQEILILSSFTDIKKGDALKMGIQTQPRDRFWSHTIASRFINDLGPTAPIAQNGSKWQADGYDITDEP